MTTALDSALAGLRSRARDEGLLDVAYAEVDSPVGRLVAARTAAGLVRLAYGDFEGGTDAVLEDLAARVSPRVLESPAELDPVRRELDEYFAGRRRDFDVPVDLSLAHGFGARVLSALRRIPFGATTTYSAVAEQAGSPRAVRAAGTACGRNPIPIVVPCHRVLRSGGGLGGYTGGLERKRALLAVEGIGGAPLAPGV